VSNGEGWWPDSARKRLIRKLVNEKAEEVSRREGIDRRDFMASACGMATTLYMINMINGCASGKTAKDNRLGMAGTPGSTGASGKGASGHGATGGYGGIPAEAMENEDMASCILGMGGNELIIDMQSHFASPETNPMGAAGLASFIGQINNTRFPWIERTAGCMGSACLDRTEYTDQILVGSDTTIGVLSGISYSLGADGMGSGGIVALSNEDLLGGAQFLAGKFPKRMLTHCMVMPNDRIEIQLAMMERNAGTYDNWKTYPPWSPTQGGGYWLNEGVGPRMIQKGLDLNSPIFCIHKGFPLSGFSPTYTNPKDVGPAAVMFPEAYLVIYHSAFEHGLASGESTMADVANPMADVGWGPGVGKWPEGPYDEDDMDVQMQYPLDRGVNSLIKSLRDNNIGPNGTRLDGSGGPKWRVYAECGGVWPNLMTNRAEEAMHYWGKLLKHIGEDRIVWGTDCLWFGSPQPVIQAFRAFEISQEFQDKYGYPALTKERKEKILGQNAAKLQNVRNGINIHGCHSDYVSSAFLDMKRDIDGEFGPRRDMMRNVPGPRTRREFLALRDSEHQEKVSMSGRIPSRG
jgi:predicted TIM-barrel fold metal-dependent hydrolase